MTDAALTAIYERAERALADYLSAMRNSPATTAEDIELARWWMRQLGDQCKETR